MVNFGAVWRFYVPADDHYVVKREIQFNLKLYPEATPIGGSQARWR
jgi:hypothetical protein